MAFMLAEASSFPRKLQVIAGGNSADLGRSAKVVKEIQHYLAIKTVVSAATGISSSTVPAIRSTRSCTGRGRTSTTWRPGTRVD